MNYHYLESWVLFVGVLVVVVFAVAMSSIVNAKTEKQVEVTPVQNLQYYGVFPHGVSSFETSDAKCFVNNSQLNRDDRSRVSISCFKK
ncbi:MAG: hypothetical protein IJ187_02970 [Neisseriaceae bacterium]|nr:hypothetical protein [Neisseriaceae bacterium]